MLTIYSPDHHQQHAQRELIDGQWLPPYEHPDRAERVLAQVQASHLGEVKPPQDFGRSPLLRVHSPAYLHFLEKAWTEWIAVHGETDALPLNWAARSLRQDRIPEAIDGKLSYYSFDAGTPITAGTWRAAYAAAQVALTGQQAVSYGDRAAFALCRPPGHHAAQDVYGGYCFLNNAAIAAQGFRDAGAVRVAVLDVDYHHGNGTQSIFYDRSDVLVASIHAHPQQEYPYFLGYDDELGAGAGLGYNFNYPLAWGTDWSSYQEAFFGAIGEIVDYAPDALVVSLGVDTFERDPISNFKLKTTDYLTIGRVLSRMELPTLFVLEGGYAIAELGENVVNVLLGFEASQQ